MHPRSSLFAAKLVKRLFVLSIFCLATALLGTAQEDGRRLTAKIRPVWPEVARKFNISGTVKLQVTVAPNGDVKAIKAIGGHPVLIDSAMTAVREWKYEPAAHETTTTVEIKFAPGA